MHVLTKYVLIQQRLSRWCNTEHTVWPECIDGRHCRIAIHRGLHDEPIAVVAIDHAEGPTCAKARWPTIPRCEIHHTNEQRKDRDGSPQGQQRKVKSDCDRQPHEHAEKKKAEYDCG